MTVRQLWRLSRPVTLSASAVPLLVGIGAALGAHEAISWGLAGLFAAVAFLLQAAANMANEYFDYLRGIDQAGAQGIAGVLVAGELSPPAVLKATAATFSLAFLLGVPLALARGDLLLGLGVLAIVLALAYSAGPRPVAGTPLGEFVVFWVMGPLEVFVSELSAGGAGSRVALLASVTVGLLVGAILMANNLRDLQGDAASGRRTLAVVLGPHRSRQLLLAVVASALVWPAAAAAAGLMPPTAAIVLIVVPLAWRLSRTGPGRRLLPAVSGIHLLSGFILALALASWPLLHGTL